MPPSNAAFGQHGRATVSNRQLAASQPEDGPSSSPALGRIGLLGKQTLYRLSYSRSGGPYSGTQAIVVALILLLVAGVLAFP
jgi:hypothetical protein